MPFSVVTRRLVLSRRVGIAVALLLSVAVGALAQVRFGDFGRFGGRRRPFTPLPNVGYDGRFTFVRVSYETAPGGYWWRGQPAWSHGYPIAEQNLMKIMNEVSYLDAHDAEINTLTLDDPELFRYPVAYIIEVSWWTLTDPRGGGAADVHAEGRLRDRRRLQGVRRLRQPRLGGLRGEHEARPARGALLRDAGVAPDLSLASSRSTT